MSYQANLRRLLGATTVLTLAGSSSIAGDLNPPPGPAAPTMRTLDEVEARIIVNQTFAPGDATATHVISDPGSYYLTGDVIGEAGKDGIRIETRDVTLDLNGYTVLLNTAGTPTVNGISAWPDTGETGSVVIRNGHVRGWRTGVGLLGPGSVEDITASDNASAGFAVNYGTVLRCIAENNLNGFVLVSGIVRDSVARTNTSNGFKAGDLTSFVGCVSEGNTGDGFMVEAFSVFNNCRATLNINDGFQIGPGSVVTGCYSALNGYGYYAPDNAGNPGSRFDSNTAFSNTNAGFLISDGSCVVVRNVAQGNTPDYNINPISQQGDIVTFIGLVGNSGPWVNFGTPTIEATGADAPPVISLDKR